jgi:ABC-2 type transport system ATP-binding protein
MRVGEALDLFASLHPAPQPLDQLAAEWQLEPLWRRPFAALSGGERQRLFVALALVGRPELVFLDELTQNLDPVGRRHTWDVVRRIRDAGTTVVLVTHDVEEAERLCDRIVVLDRGIVVADGTPASIVERLGGTTTVRFTDGDLDVRELRFLPGVQHVGRHGIEVHVEGTGPLLAHVGAHLVAVGRPALDLRADRPTLEDRFVALTQERSS